MSTSARSRSIGVLVVAAFAMLPSTARADEPTPTQEAAPTEAAPTQSPAPTREPEPVQTPAEPASEPRLALGPSLAFGFSTPTHTGGLFNHAYALVDVRFVIAIRAVGPLWVRIEPGTTMSWNATTERTPEQGALVEPHTVRVHSVGVRALATVELSSRASLRGGGLVSYGGAALPSGVCGGETRGGFGGGGILGGGFRIDPDRRFEIGTEVGVAIYPYAAKCLEVPAERRYFASLQENPELTFTLGLTWFAF